MSGDIFFHGCNLWGAPGISWVKVKDATKHLTLPRIIPAAKNYPAQTVDSDIILVERQGIKRRRQVPNIEQSRGNRKGCTM